MDQAAHVSSRQTHTNNSRRAFLFFIDFNEEFAMRRFALHKKLILRELVLELARS